jgi:hypothetical protein
MTAAETLVGRLGYICITFVTPMSSCRRVNRSYLKIRQRDGHGTVASEESKKKYWSAEVTGRSNALALEAGVFTWTNPRRIAESLKHSAEASTRRKGTPLQSAMAMLNFYINRAGANLPGPQRRVLIQAKVELRRLFGR